MASALTETTIFDASVTVPDDGDTANSASITTFAQSLANRTQTIKLRDMPERTVTGSPASSWTSAETMAVGTNNSATMAVSFTNILENEQIIIIGHCGIINVGAGFHGFKLRESVGGVNIDGFYAEVGASAADTNLSIFAIHTFTAAAGSATITLQVENSTNTVEIGSPLNLQVIRLNPGV